MSVGCFALHAPVTTSACPAKKYEVGVVGGVSNGSAVIQLCGCSRSNESPASPDDKMLACVPECNSVVDGTCRPRRPLSFGNGSLYHL